MVMAKQSLRINNYGNYRIGLSGMYLLLIFTMIIMGCEEESNTPLITPPDRSIPEEEVLVEGVDYFLPHIDLNNWKVTLACKIDLRG